MTTLNISQKNVNDGKNTFFKNNKMLIGTAAPTSGTYTRGDVVVNAGLDNDKNNMWICIESGSPGEWILIGGKPMITSRARVVITDPIAEVPMTELGMPVEKDDKLDVYLNSTHLLEGEDYIINSSGTKIRKKSGIWNLTGDPAVFDFVLMKYVDKVDGNNVTINTENRETKIASIVEKVQVIGTQTEVAIPNMNFNQEFDTLLVFKNGMIMIDGIDYQISNGNLVSLTGPWNQSNVDDYEMTFILLKEVLVYEGEIFGNFQEKIDSNLQTNDKTVVGAINELFQNANNGEALEDFQEKIDNNLQTESKTVVGAINELFQSANNGKELIANAIGEPLDASDTFSAMSDKITEMTATFKNKLQEKGVSFAEDDKVNKLIGYIDTMHNVNDVNDYIQEIETLENDSDGYRKQLIDMLTAKNIAVASNATWPTVISGVSNAFKTVIAGITAGTSKTLYSQTWTVSSGSYSSSSNYASKTFTLAPNLNGYTANNLTLRIRFSCPTGNVYSYCRASLNGNYLAGSSSNFASAYCDNGGVTYNLVNTDVAYSNLNNKSLTLNAYVTSQPSYTVTYTVIITGDYYY